MKTKIIVAVAMVSLLTLGAFADLNGRDLVDKGTVSTLSGSITIEDSEWYLQTESGKYIVHQGPLFYQDEIGIKVDENDKASVKGYVYEDEITPLTITVDGKEYSFRDEDGRPEWAGRGQRDQNNMRRDGSGYGYNRNNNDPIQKRDGTGNGQGYNRNNSEPLQKRDGTGSGYGNNNNAPQWRRVN